MPHNLPKTSRKLPRQFELSQNLEKLSNTIGLPCLWCWWQGCWCWGFSHCDYKQLSWDCSSYTIKWCKARCKHFSIEPQRFQSLEVFGQYCRFVYFIFHKFSLHFQNETNFTLRAMIPKRFQRPQLQECFCFCGGRTLTPLTLRFLFWGLHFFVTVQRTCMDGTPSNGFSIFRSFSAFDIIRDISTAPCSIIRHI